MSHFISKQIIFHLHILATQKLQIEAKNSEQLSTTRSEATGNVGWQIGSQKLAGRGQAQSQQNLIESVLANSPSLSHRRRGAARRPVANFNFTRSPFVCLA